MSLSKSIKHGKEHRKPHCKSKWDKSATYKRKKQNLAAEDKMKFYIKEV